MIQLSLNDIVMLSFFESIIQFLNELISNKLYTNRNSYSFVYAYSMRFQLESIEATINEAN